jgi:hypothetical protein
MFQVTRRQALTGGLLSLFAVALADGGAVVAQLLGPTTDTPLPVTQPTFIMFHVEAGW